MDYYNKTALSVAKELSSDVSFGLKPYNVQANRDKYGLNVISKRKGKNIFNKIFSALLEPMMIILLFGFALTVGVNLGRFIKTGEGDFTECLGILCAVILSVSITLIMEGSSEKAFRALDKIYDAITVKTIRGGRITYLKKEEIVVGDIILIESGDKIVADGRLIEANSLSIDESALTGESMPINKDAKSIEGGFTPLAERKNCLYSGTYALLGSGKMLVTAVGDNTEIGKIASELKNEREVPSPLNQKLSKLGKTVTLIGIFFAVFVFIVSIIKLAITKNLTFLGVQNLFISCVVLIVAAVPEGLPTIVAVSLALNMIKLAKENALIKKMTATETAGAVSVICSDKTGTLTENKMKLISLCESKYCTDSEGLKKAVVLQNFAINSTAELEKKGKEFIRRGNATECALLEAYNKSAKEDYKNLRKRYKIIDRIPFSSQTKYMTTTIEIDGIKRTYLKGAPEKVLEFCSLNENQKREIISKISISQSEAKRVLCFAHNDGNGYVFDGFGVIADGVRPDVKKAVKDCKRAGIKIKILTGDNEITAFAVAKELDILDGKRGVINASEIENMSDDELKKALSKITVIARSTPMIKLRVVKTLKSMGEVVAVTGDGINDAPAIKHADVGVAMGKSGSDITKEAADVVLLDDGFSTIVKAISFGRNVYKNIQRFIVFQLSVNVSALLFITITAIFGIETPFNTLQLLWINVIMDGPPALTLGLEKSNDKLMDNPPISRADGILNSKMLVRIIFNGVFIAVIMSLQHFNNILGVKDMERSGAIFTLFIVFQLFNAFNCRELGSSSVLKNFANNKIMAITFASTFIVQVLIVQFAYPLFGVSPLSFLSWLKIVLTGSSVILLTEAFKFIYKNTIRSIVLKKN